MSFICGFFVIIDFYVCFIVCLWNMFVGEMQMIISKNIEFFCLYVFDFDIMQLKLCLLEINVQFMFLKGFEFVVWFLN